MRTSPPCGPCSRTRRRSAATRSGVPATWSGAARIPTRWWSSIRERRDPDRPGQLGRGGRHGPRRHRLAVGVAGSRAARPGVAGLDGGPLAEENLAWLRQLPTNLRLEVDGSDGPALPRQPAQAERVPLGGSAVAPLRAHRERRGGRPLLLRPHARDLPSRQRARPTSSRPAPSDAAARATQRPLRGRSTSPSRTWWSASASIAVRRERGPARDERQPGFRPTC